MSKNAKLSIIVAGLAVLVVATLLIATGGDEPSGSTSPTTTGGAEAEVVADNTHFLQQGSSDVTVTEFLDFECESCLALFPVMERLREEYDGEVGFAIRYFPIPSHTNAQIAAQAVEAAAKQGALEEMYIKMYETQPEWGEQQESKRELFVSFAEEMGLDMEQFEKDLDAESTIERVNFDQQAGTELGVTGTPTLFLNGEPFQPGPYEQMKAEIDAALEGS